MEGSIQQYDSTDPQRGVDTPDNTTDIQLDSFIEGSSADGDGQATAASSSHTELTRLRQLEILSNLATDLLAAEDPDEMVQQLFHTLSSQFGIDAGFNYMVSKPGEEMQLKAYIGVPPHEAERIERLRFGQAVCGLVAQTQKPVYVSHVQQSALPHTELIRKYGIEAYACQPLMAGDQLVGTLSFGTRRRHYFSEEELNLIRTISIYVSLAKERLRAERDLRQSNETLEERVQMRTRQVRKLAAQLEEAEQAERSRLARELHDSAGQVLTALLISLQLLQQSVPDSDQTFHEGLAEVRQLAEQAHETVRTISHSLRPPELEKKLDVALEALCQQFSTQTGLPVQYACDTVPDLPSQVKLTYYRFLQEALTNAARHANASRVDVHLNCDAGEISLTVKDDGTGFTATTERGIGLKSIRERFELIGGDVQIYSRPGDGTRLIGRYVLPSTPASKSSPPPRPVGSP